MSSEINRKGHDAFNGWERWEKWCNDWNEARTRVRTQAERRGINLSEIPILCGGEIRKRARK